MQNLFFDSIVSYLSSEETDRISSCNTITIYIID